MEKREYKRDKRSPTPKNPTVSKVMSSIKAKNTTPETFFRKTLYSHGIRGYRIHYKTLPGKPDIIFTKNKFAIFINGCFWHSCPYCELPLPKTNIDFWKEKFAKNKLRDEIKTKQLEHLGWKVLTIWECQIKSDITNILALVKKILK
jgi:DNA mismatch endonuclease, patch repair protein